MHNYGQESEKFVKFQVFKLFDKLNKYNGITLPCVPFFFILSSTICFHCAGKLNRFLPVQYSAAKALQATQPSRANDH